MDRATLTELKNQVAADVQRRADMLIGVSHDIHAHPELCFEETYAHDLLTSTLEAAGFGVERSTFGIPTAFRAAFGSGSPTVAVCCEYDALPEIGHACGHNIIAAAGLGAGLAAAAVADRAHGRVVVLGTPAEEGGGGKVLMIDAGAFADVDVAMMVHPADVDLDGFHAIAIHELHCDFHGRASHAAAAPERGRNALDAAVLAYVNIAALRQHIGDDERVHGIFTHGGDKPNVVPHRASMQWYVRSTDRQSLHALEERVLACLGAGAAAAGCTIEYRWKEPAYDNLISAGPVANCYVANAAGLGRTVRPVDSIPAFKGSTDMGNVSHVVPSIHPMIQAAEPGTAIHTPAFAEAANSALGDRAVLDGATALACTIVDMWADPGVLTTTRPAAP